MQGSTRCICKFSHHLKQPMICCDKCAKWQHASCMGITPAKFAEYNKCKDLQYHCEKCEPRYIDEERARAIQEGLLKKEANSSSSQESNKNTTSTDTASTDDDEIVKKQEERKSSRDDRKNAQLEELFKKMENNPKQGRRRGATAVQKQKEKNEDKEHHHDEDAEEEPSDEEETAQQKVPKKGRRGRPKGSGNKRRHLDVSLDHGEPSEPGSAVKRQRQHRKPREIRQTDSPGYPVDDATLASPLPGGAATSSMTSHHSATSAPISSTRSSRLKGKRPRGRPGVGRRPKAASSVVSANHVIDQSEQPEQQQQQQQHEQQEGSDTEDSADSGLVEECEVVNLTVPLKNPYSVRRRLDISKFENVKSFGQDVTITFHDWEWRGGNNSKVIKKTQSDTWTSSLGVNNSGGHFKKQWLMKNTEETKEVPDVNEIIREELRKRNVDLTKIPELNENGQQDHQLLNEPKDDNSDQSSQKSDSQPIWHVEPSTPSNTSSIQPQASPGGGETRSDTDSEKKKTEEKTKKLSMAEYLARNRERKKREAEEKAKLEAERQKQQESRLSNDAVTAVLSSAIGAATNGSKVCDINADDITWLSRLVGINLNANGMTQNALAELPIETTAERLSRLYHTSEQVLNTMRAANVLAALTAQQNK